NDGYIPLTGRDVEYRLANLGQLTIEMTEKCILNCHYCTYGDLYSFVNRKGTDIPFSLIRNILVYLEEKMNSPLNASSSNPFYISFYGGEPLVNFAGIKETVDLVEKMNFSNNVVVFSMTTNGFFLNKYMDYLKEHHFRLLISLDGDKAGNCLRVDHNEKSQFDRIFSNIKSLKNKYPDYFKSSVNFNAVLNRHNSVESITKFIETYFDKLPTISSINPYGLNPGKIADFYHIYSSPQQSFAEADSVMDIKEKFFIQHPEVKEVFMFLRLVCGNSFRDYNSFLYDETRNRLPTGTCLPFFKRMFVSVNGALLPCENVSHDNALGYVYETGVELDYEKIAELYNNAFQELSEQCSQCYGRAICSQCLFEMKTKFKCSELITKKDLQEKFSRAITFVENNPTLYARMMEEVCVE
ncbi:MAG: radical SAM peptide maturase, partial [Candidatus Aminicenantes bacterium]